ncbi:MAG TPA: ATP-binding protein [Jiangellaceae bacterium]|nr:ATP-binding protein [Jiangellaceae bacterium]
MTPGSEPSTRTGTGSLDEARPGRAIGGRLRALTLVPIVALLLLGGVLIVAATMSGLSTVWTVVAAVVVAAVVVATIVVVLRTSTLVRSSLNRLRSSTRRAVEDELPASMSRLRTEGPGAARSLTQAVEPEADDQLGDVASAFNELHATAMRVAAEQAALRANLDAIVVNLSRRTRSLVDRQLHEITDLESGEGDPDRLAQLFRIDHLSTRIRRHAESLLVLAGVEERRTTTPAPALDVARTAVGEVEQYQRVRFGVIPGDLVAAGAVDDVAHVLAELIDNATEFSAPETSVTISGTPLIGGGLRIAVADAGIGLKPDQVEQLNTRLREGGELDIASSRTLGLYVVSRLSARHGLGVRLAPGEGRGTVAQVDLPAHLLVSALDTSPGTAAEPAQEQPLPQRVSGQSGNAPATHQAQEGPADERFRAFAAEDSPPAQDTPRESIGAASEQHPRERMDETPLFSSVQSVWFDAEQETERHTASRPAEGGERQEERSQPTVSSGKSPLTEASWTAGGAPGPAGDDDSILGPAGLPRRRRGAALSPGTLRQPSAEDDKNDSAGGSYADARGMSGALSSLQTGVGRGRAESSGWVPERPEQNDDGSESPPGTDPPRRDT